LEALGRWAPEVPTMRLLEWGGVLPWHLDASWRAGRLALAPTWRALNTDYRWLTPRRVADLARKGLACCPYTIDREPDMRRAVGMGAAGLITNEVGTALALKAALA
jgi:glycerophosphoryl diester phosphodiesterase